MTRIWCFPGRIVPETFGLLLSIFLLVGCGETKSPTATGETAEDQFQRLSTQGKGLFDAGEAAKAAEAFRQAVALQPTHPDARQNFATALLRANDAAGAAAQASELIRLNQNLGAAHYLLGAALLRQGKAEAALAGLQVAKDLDRTVNAVSYLLGRAHQELGHFDEALALFEEVLQFETNHPSANYNLSQVLTRQNRPEDAARALEAHRAVLTGRAGSSIDQWAVEKCVHTEIRVPFRLEQPAGRGIPVRFDDATSDVFGPDAGRYAGPVGVIDINHNGAQDLVVREGEAQFRLLINTAGRFTAAPNVLNTTNRGQFRKVLVGDLNKDRYEDLVILGDRGLHAFRLATNGQAMDSTAFSNLRRQPAEDGLLIDLDFTGNLDLILVNPTNRALRVLRNLGNMYFTNGTVASGLSAGLTNVTGLLADDWNGDELNDLFVSRPGMAPDLWHKTRGGALTNVPASSLEWPVGALVAVGDLNNDLRGELVVAHGREVRILFNGLGKDLVLPLGDARGAPRSVTLLDYDNDGWLDLLLATEDGLRAWRNAGDAGFAETTTELGLDRAVTGAVQSVATADLDGDCDTDLVLETGAGTLRVLRNQGGHANPQLRLRLLGTRSNPSALGLRIELTSGNWRAIRTVHRLPVEIGVGQRTKIDSLNIRWFDTLSTDVDTPVQCGVPLAMVELVRPTGSCPYLYRWNGTEFTFVTDLLGAAPMGLPVAEGRYIEADPDEIVRLGTEAEFPARDGRHLVQITEELREVLYLDEAKLVVVDHPPGTEVHPTDKLVPGRPFPATGVMTLRNRVPLRQAENLAGQDVTDALQTEDHVMVSPLELRPPQQRGYARTHGVVLDFGSPPPGRPWVLALTGWLRFGGGMANMSVSRDPEAPFPFPRLEVETGAGWQPLDVPVGAPCGKTKTILVDLAGRLPDGARRLRLTAAFEIHWDRIALFERAPEDVSRITWVAPDSSDLHWRGYSEFKDLPWTQPLTPDYARVRSWPDWRITPSGWCTRYGPVDELIAHRDGGLALLNGGDELTLGFPAASVPAKTAPDRARTFFLFTVGWDKDADFHVVQGDKVEPLPWEGMDDQAYGREARPPQPGDALNRRYNTRWVGPIAQVRR